jgi:6-phosphogluconolactonase
MTSRANILIGTYTTNASDDQPRGVHLHHDDTPLHIAPSSNPSYLAVHPTRALVYAVNETGTSGGVSAFRLHSDRLEFINRQSSRGADPCHLVVDRTGRYVLVANYSSGTVSVLPILEDGALGEACDVIQHVGVRAPHAHGVTLDHSNRFLLVPDLGLDRVMIYRFDAQRGKLETHDQPWVQMASGAGPRQVVFHPLQPWAYVICEYASVVVVLRYDAAFRAVNTVQSISSLPQDFVGVNTGADVRVSPDGRFLYASNRGHDSIVVYAIARDGTLRLIGHESSGGQDPRCFTIHADGHLLLVANQTSSVVREFTLDAETGGFSGARVVLSVPSPVFVQYL